ncbi:hypothetical protein [Acidaminobacter sp.]|nr:hypothetical protein [Acidaminobacter sp.]MDK9710812.1 hypothetical protein [Acidaminobacter sp.]
MKQWIKWLSKLIWIQEEPTPPLEKMLIGGHIHQTTMKSKFQR